MALERVLECARDAELLGMFDVAERMRLVTGHIVEVKAAFHGECRTPCRRLARDEMIPCWGWVEPNGYSVVSVYKWRVAAMLGIKLHPDDVKMSIKALDAWWAHKQKARA